VEQVKCVIFKFFKRNLIPNRKSASTLEYSVKFPEKCFPVGEQVSNYLNLAGMFTGRTATTSQVSREPASTERIIRRSSQRSSSGHTASPSTPSSAGSTGATNERTSSSSLNLRISTGRTERSSYDPSTTDPFRLPSTKTKSSGPIGRMRQSGLPRKTETVSKASQIEENIALEGFPRASTLFKYSQGHE